MIGVLVLCAVLAALGCGLLLRLGEESARRYGDFMPQRFHIGHVPRLGGAAMFVACVGGWAWLAGAEHFGVVHGIPFDALHAATWCLVGVVGVAAGVIEDLTHQLRARSRFVSTGLAAILAVVLFGLAVPRTGVPLLDAAWTQVPWLQMAAAVFVLAGLPHAFNIIDGYNGLAGTVALICCAALAIGGLPHAFNIIDGYNGLAGTVAVLVCLAISHVALQVGDRQLAAMVICLVGATLGFLIWNYPRGKIFAGDGGAYVWGMVIAIAAVTLVQRHRVVSPWFPMLLLIYPVWETLFSIYRKVARGQSPSTADALHFHQLIFRRIVRVAFADDEARQLLARNNRTSPYLWIFAALTVVPAVLFWNNTLVLIGFCILFIATYVVAYLMIVRFKVPRWLRP
jgi:UDP-N-acetylmuramyl pentapeptide phosphotransferase/UDP-N-acetylglucosamine-1-phosphate transferase